MRIGDHRVIWAQFYDHEGHANTKGAVPVSLTEAHEITPQDLAILLN